MMDVGRHPHITLMAYSEVENISGYVGNFRVRVRRKTRFVDETACTACGDCTDVCPIAVPDEFQHGFSSRKAIYIPFPQAVPSAYLINPDECLGDTPIACGKCREVCDVNCIDFDMPDRIVDLEVGIIIVATGLDVYNPIGLDEYGYSRYENVITSLEFERLISAGGPTEGHLIRPTDRQHPHRIAFIQCVGSRTDIPADGNGKRGVPFCNNICCMNTVKDSLLLKEHYPDIDITVFYMDIRAFGKGFEALYRRSKTAGVRYVRGLPGRIIEDADTQNLWLTVEDTTANKLTTQEFDMVILSLGFIPSEDQTHIKHMLTLSTTSDGLFLEAHPKLRPVDATTRGVFFAGCVESPKDVKDSVTQASAAAARAQTILNQDKITIEAITAVVDQGLCNACGRCARVCPYSAIAVDPKQKIKAAIVQAACAGCGTCGAECPESAITMHHFTDLQIEAQIDAALAENPEDKTLVFACNWCSYAGADFAGVSRLQHPPNARIVRTMCSGRVAPEFVLRAFAQGAAMVLVSGCHFADCHYINANQVTQQRVDQLWNKLERLGVRPERLQLEWISAAEGQKWAQVMHDIETLRWEVTTEEIAATQDALGPIAMSEEETHEQRSKTEQV